jgi:hypothetical protein
MFSWFISVDDHLIEPARLWQERLPEAARAIAPRIERDGASEFWVYEDRQIVTTGLNAVAGKSKEEFSPEPITYEDMRPGCYEPAERVADMNQGFVVALASFVESQKSGVSKFIADQVRHWDLAQLTRLIEMNIGRDLQYIRFNGMIIGGLAGIVLYTIELLLPVN